jgi:hypothetical protein
MPKHHGSEIRRNEDRLNMRKVLPALLVANIDDMTGRFAPGDIGRDEAVRSRSRGCLVLGRTRSRLQALRVRSELRVSAFLTHEKFPVFYEPIDNA